MCLRDFGSGSPRTNRKQRTERKGRLGPAHSRDRWRLEPLRSERPVASWPQTNSDRNIYPRCPALCEATGRILSGGHRVSPMCLHQPIAYRSVSRAPETWDSAPLPPRAEPLKPSWTGHTGSQPQPFTRSIPRPKDPSPPVSVSLEIQLERPRAESNLYLQGPGLSLECCLLCHFSLQLGSLSDRG